MSVCLPLGWRKKRMLKSFLAAVLLSASVEKCFVSRMRDFLGTFLTVLGIFTYFNTAKKPYLKNLSHIQNINIFSKRNFWFKKNALGILGMVLAFKSKLAPKVTVWAVISDHISSYFAHRWRRKNVYHPIFSKTSFWWLEFGGEKSVFRVWQLSTRVPIKMLVSSQIELHTPRQTLGFSTVS